METHRKRRTRDDTHSPFPILEYVCLASPTKHDTRLMLPQIFREPHLQYLVLGNFVSPIVSPLLTAVRLVTLAVEDPPIPAFSSQRFAATAVPRASIGDASDWLSLCFYP